MNIRDLVRQEIDRIATQKTLSLVGSKSRISAQSVSRSSNPIFRLLSYVFDRGLSGDSAGSSDSPYLTKGLFLKRAYWSVSNDFVADFIQSRGGAVSKPIVSHEHAMFSIDLYCSVPTISTLNLHWNSICSVFLNGEAVYFNNYLSREAVWSVPVSLVQGRNRLDIAVYNASGQLASFTFSIDISSVDAWSTPDALVKVWSWPDSQSFQIQVSEPGTTWSLDSTEGFDFPVVWALPIIEKVRNDTTGELTYDVDFANVHLYVQGQSMTISPYTPPDPAVESTQEGCILVFDIPTDSVYTFWVRVLAWGFAD